MLDDPLGLIVQGIAVLAAGMYPLGLLFGTCSDCCCVCGRSQGPLNPYLKRWCCRGTHPEEITVRVSNGTATGTMLCFGEDPNKDEVELACDSVEGDYVLARTGCNYAYIPEPPCDEGEEYSCPEGEFSFAGFVGIAIRVSIGSTNSLICVEGPGLEFSGSCFGSGAAGVVDKVTAGEITGVKITNGGSGYATLGREEPTVTLSNANTKAAAVSFSYTKSSDECGRQLWSISGATVISGGDGYANAQPAAFTLAAGTKGSGASGTIYTQRAEPVLEASYLFSGSGVTFTVNVEETGADPPTWRVKSVTFEGEGKNYQEGEPLYFSGSDVVTLEAAQAVVRVTYSSSPPAAEVRPDFVSGDGASLSVTLSPNGGNPPTWSVASASIDAAGTGYAQFDSFQVYDADTGDFLGVYLDVAAVGENGEITAVTIDAGGPLRGASQLDSVEVLSGGEYYGGNKILDSIEITNGGEYYGENPSLAPHVSTPDVNVVYIDDGKLWSPPGDGTGAKVSATVEANTTSPDFGKVVSLKIDDGGQDYELTQYQDPCGPDAYNVVVQMGGFFQYVPGKGTGIFGILAKHDGTEFVYVIGGKYRQCILGQQCDLRGVIKGETDIDCDITKWGETTFPATITEKIDGIDFQTCDTCNSVPLGRSGDAVWISAAVPCSGPPAYCIWTVEILPQ